MKNFYLSTLILFGSIFTSFGQAPELINYQAIVRDLSGASVTNQSVGVRVSILESSSSGTEVFAETHTPTTNNYGLINLQIGNGTLAGPALSTIDWGANIYFVKIEIDPTGGTAYTIVSTSQLISVPYALHAKTVENSDDADADPTNEYNTGAVLNADTLELTDGGGMLSVDLSSLGDDADADPTNEIQTLSKAGNIVTLSDGGGAFTDDVDDADNDPTNEINQSVGLSGTTLTISDGGGNVSVDLGPLQDGVNDADSDPTNEFQTISLAGSTATLSDGGGSFSIDDADADASNELQTISLAGSTVTLSDGGGSVSINDADSDASNELQTISLSGSTVTLSDGGGSVSIDDADSDPANEHNISGNLSGTDLNIIDGGGTVTVDLSPLAGVSSFHVGEHYQGGIIVYVDSTGTGGLICGLTDLSAGIEFDPPGDGNDATGYADNKHDGVGNTAALVAQWGAGTTYAAGLCDNYAGGGFTDWYLPSMFELLLIANSGHVLKDNALVYDGRYWTSGEEGIGALGGVNAFSVSVLYGIETYSQLAPLRVRPVRAF